MTVNNYTPRTAPERSAIRMTENGRTASVNTDFASVLDSSQSAAPEPSGQPATVQASRAPVTPRLEATSIAAPAPAPSYDVKGLITAGKPSLGIPSVVYPSAACTTPAGEKCPTAEEVFGANPWQTSPTGYSAGLGVYNYNPKYFATRQTAEKVAQMLGGKVVEQNAFVGDGGPFFQSQPNYMVELPNGHRVNAGLTAEYFTHGWTQSQVDRMLNFDRNV
jgi:hypothetical protein